MYQLAASQHSAYYLLEIVFQVLCMIGRAQAYWIRRKLRGISRRVPTWLGTWSNLCYKRLASLSRHEEIEARK